MKAGQFLHASSLLDESIFEQAIIFITEHNDKGAMGFIVNKQFSRGLTELEEFKHGIPFPLYEGGPVDQEHLFFVHQRPDLIPDGSAITEKVYYGGDFKTAVAHINTRVLTGHDIKIFIGYCGWDNEELEAEIAEGSWKLTDAGEIFD
ncbi:YqgE/AlgH family protein [Chitinophaga sancti]|uniref:Putative transcriptional regulator n=1 Tax=Chitinophaga sancti TaxID=1004 RepID=A0A1K1R7W3_9BACT|nr:YqgE/AlgH family protein [Chitinophaga sancti]WQD64175.1 YqgE/AlgH family protein [Chitinophaga sancti]WQG90201.1 YqgE/AlgH family protein [Chitinophaga sancti]SFW67734.1 putative transcriptional regulator [Chitinophaga sancti]